ncbi:MAG: alpha/beta hydrolase [Actinomycetia bacterium]|nr:alpha/beta hydrolase [Actinomycetes bacterium]
MPIEQTTTPAHTVTGGGGTQLHVREWGRPDGPAILLIHGWSGSHQAWRRQVEGPLAGEFRLVALDLRGHGMSQRSEDPADYADGELWADDVAAVIDQLSLRQPVLVGWSYGGFVVADYLRVHGEAAVAAVVLVDAAMLLTEQFDHIGPGFLENAPDTCSGDLPTVIAGVRRFVRALTAEPMSTEDHETVLGFMMAVPAEVRGALLGRGRLDFDDVLAGLTVPVLVTHGRQDTVVLPSMAEHVLDVCPTAVVSWYDRVGHAPFLEDPERFDRELADLTRQVRG